MFVLENMVGGFDDITESDGFQTLPCVGSKPEISDSVFGVGPEDFHSWQAASGCWWLRGHPLRTAGKMDEGGLQRGMQGAAGKPAGAGPKSQEARSPKEVGGDSGGQSSDR